MEAIMRGDIRPVVPLDSMSVRGTYAVGAEERLAGEILIMDGRSYVGRYGSRGPFLDTASGHWAALLVWATVDRWISAELSHGLHEPDDAIETAARHAGMAVDEPFPFLLEGVVDTLRWHIVGGPGSHVQSESTLSGSTVERSVKVVGFHSPRHEGVWTHHGSHLHMHVLVDTIVGHIDDIDFGPDMSIFLPEQP
jgi:acetolactate decarboxylase